MKTLIITLIIVILFGNYDLISQEKSDSTSVVPTLLNFDLILTVGIGYTTHFATFEQYMKQGPVFSLGLELPLIKSHNFSLELYGHIWYAKSKYSDENHLKELSNHYNQISKEYFSQSGISASLKYYLELFEDKVKVSCHLGWLFLSYYSGYRAVDFGLGLYYFLTKHTSISINRRLPFTLQGHDGSSDVTPTSIQLSFNYNINR